VGFKNCKKMEKKREKVFPANYFFFFAFFFIFQTPGKNFPSPFAFFMQ